MDINLAFRHPIYPYLKIFPTCAPDRVVMRSQGDRGIDGGPRVVTVATEKIDTTQLPKMVDHQQLKEVVVLGAGEVP